MRRAFVIIVVIAGIKLCAQEPMPIGYELQGTKYSGIEYRDSGSIPNLNDLNDTNVYVHTITFRKKGFIYRISNGETKVIYRGQSQEFCSGTKTELSLHSDRFKESPVGEEKRRKKNRPLPYRKFLIIDKGNGLKSDDGKLILKLTN